MTKATLDQIRRLANLSQLTALALEARLGELRKAAEARDATWAALQALKALRPKVDGDIPMPIQARTDILYERWVEKRRAEMNLLLARQTAKWLEQREGAAAAFGRNDVLLRLTEGVRNRLRLEQRRS